MAFALRPVYNIGFSLYYELNIDYIVEKYCVNKDKPVLQCNGKCYLTQKLNSIDTQESAIETRGNSIVEAFYPLFYQEVVCEHKSKIFWLLSENNYPIIKTYSRQYRTVIDRPPIL